MRDKCKKCHALFLSLDQKIKDNHLRQAHAEESIRQLETNLKRCHAVAKKSRDEAEGKELRYQEVARWAEDAVKEQKATEADKKAADEWKVAADKSLAEAIKWADKQLAAKAEAKVDAAVAKEKAEAAETAAEKAAAEASEFGCCCCCRRRKCSQGQAW